MFDLEINMPLNGIKMFLVVSSISKNIALYVPKNTKRNQLMNLDSKKGFTGSRKLQKKTGRSKKVRFRDTDGIL